MATRCCRATPPARMSTVLAAVRGGDWPWGPCTCGRGRHTAGRCVPELLVKPRCDFRRLQEPGGAGRWLVLSVCQHSGRVCRCRPLFRPSGRGGCPALVSPAARPLLAGPSVRASPARRHGALSLLLDGLCLRSGGLEVSFRSRRFISGNWQLVTCHQDTWAKSAFASKVRSVTSQLVKSSTFSYDLEKNH